MKFFFLIFLIFLFQGIINCWPDNIELCIEDTESACLDHCLCFWQNTTQTCERSQENKNSDSCKERFEELLIIGGVAIGIVLLIVFCCVILNVCSFFKNKEIYDKRDYIELKGDKNFP